MNKYIVCHYGEIGLKGKNRIFFEKKLVDNIRSAFNSSLPGMYSQVSIVHGRIVVILSETGEKETERITEVLKKVFGIVNFAFAVNLPQEISQLKAEVWNLIKTKEFATFRITTQRSNKSYPMTSHEIDMEIGGHVVDQCQKRVSLKNPDLNCMIEIVAKKAYLFFEKIQASGGMPVGSSHKVAILMSGGIDSPVAAHFVLKRGCPVLFIHFHSMPFTSKQSLEKTRDLMKVLKTYGAEGKVYMVPFAETQKQIFSSAPEKLRVVLYRRFMMRIAEKIARKEDCLALVTGESIAQVASQTIENMYAIEAVATMPVLRPVVGFDKEEIMDLARKIGTYDISIQPHDDCCMRFVPKHPETKARVNDVEAAESNLEVLKLVEDSIAGAKIENL